MKRSKFVDAIVAIVILCLIALACYEYGRLSSVEDAEEYENTRQEQEPHPPLPRSVWTPPCNEAVMELQVPY